MNLQLLRERRVDGLLAAYLIIGRLKFGIGWFPAWWRTEDCHALACNRVFSWRENRAVCVSILWLRIGFRVLANKKGQP